MLDGLKLLDLLGLLGILLETLATRDSEEVRLLLLLHLREHLLALFHEIYLHAHGFLEYLVTEIKNLLESLLVHLKHLSLVVKELLVLLNRDLWGLRRRRQVLLECRSFRQRSRTHAEIRRRQTTKIRPWRRHELLSQRTTRVKLRPSNRRSSKVWPN